MTKQEIIALFEQEFSFVNGKFEIFEFALNDDKLHAYDFKLAMPGVYMYWKEGRVLRVGRSYSNSRKRSLEHIQDNTGGIIQQLNKDPDTFIILFNLKEANDNKHLHWVAALEVYFELKLKPEIPSRL